MSLTIAVSGLDEVMRRFEPAKVQQTLHTALQRSTEALRDDTKKLPPVSKATTGFDAVGIPVNTGFLRQSIQTLDISLLAAGVVAYANYSGYVHDGTGRMPARPFFQWALEAGAQDHIQKIFEDYVTRLLNGQL